MTRGYDAIVVGAGIVGACTAHELARRGAGRVLVLERDTVASGPTGRSSGVLRHLYTHPTVVRMARDGVRAYADADADVAGSTGTRLCGWLLLVPASAETVARTGMAIEHDLDIRAEWCDTATVTELVPGIDTDDLVGAVYEPDAGYGDPALAASSFLARARELGVEYRSRTPVTEWEIKGGRLWSLVAGAERLYADVVVNCAGSWLPNITRGLGAQLPIATSRHQVVTVRDRAATTQLVVSDPARLVYMRPDGDHLTLIGSNDPADALDLVEVEQCPNGVDHDKVESLLDRASSRIPALAHAGLTGGWSGVYDISADGFPILGALPEIDGMLVAGGLSGHGFKLAPAIAELLASLVLDADPHPDAALFRAQRFDDGEPILSTTTSALSTLHAPGAES